MSFPVFTHDATDERRASPQFSVALPFEARQKARQRVIADCGAEIGIKLPRGRILRGGDCLASDDGLVLRVVASPERVSTASCDDARLLARAAYHLGNRHVWLEVGNGWVRYLHDAVLDRMLAGLGLDVVVDEQRFEPEAGAYETDPPGHGAHHHHDHRDSADPGGGHGQRGHDGRRIHDLAHHEEDAP